MSALDSDIQELRAAIDQDDLNSLNTDVLVLADSCDNRKAVDILLGAIKKNPIWNEGAACKAMLELFGVLGKTSPFTSTYRTKLSKALF